ncbi:hypothetical protein QF036_002440 [Arthrobacter globiformis]|nr:hypothetical protein [Arthrobacter globiformis]
MLPKPRKPITGNERQPVHPERQEGTGPHHRPPMKKAPEGAPQNTICLRSEAKNAPEQGKHVPEMGLELASPLANPPLFRKHPQSGPSPRPVQPNPKPQVWTLSTPSFLSLLEHQATKCAVRRTWRILLHALHHSAVHRCFQAQPECDAQHWPSISVRNEPSAGNPFRIRPDPIHPYSDTPPLVQGPPICRDCPCTPLDVLCGYLASGTHQGRSFHNFPRLVVVASYLPGGEAAPRLVRRSRQRMSALWCPVPLSEKSLMRNAGLPGSSQSPSVALRICCLSRFRRGSATRFSTFMAREMARAVVCSAWR